MRDKRQIIGDELIIPISELQSPRTSGQAITSRLCLAPFGEHLARSVAPRKIKLQPIRVPSFACPLLKHHDATPECAWAGPQRGSLTYCALHTPASRHLWFTVQLQTRCVFVWVLSHYQARSTDCGLRLTRSFRGSVPLAYIKRRPRSLEVLDNLHQNSALRVRCWRLYRRRHARPPALRLIRRWPQRILRNHKTRITSAGYHRANRQAGQRRGGME